MNIRIAFSILTILASAGIMAGATFAFFTDQATSTNNTFSAGNADLQIAVDVVGSEVFADTIAGPNFTGMFPGETRNFDFWLKNNSASAINLNLTADVDDILPAADGVQDIDNELLVRWTCDLDGNLSLGDETPTSEFSPRDWFTGGNASLGSLIPAEQMFCRMSGRLPSDTDNSVAGESVEFDVLYDATQAP